MDSIQSHSGHRGFEGDRDLASNAKIKLGGEKEISFKNPNELTAESIKNTRKIFFSYRETEDSIPKNISINIGRNTPLYNQISQEERKPEEIKALVLKYIMVLLDVHKMGEGEVKEVSAQFNSVKECSKVFAGGKEVANESGKREYGVKNRRTRTFKEQLSHLATVEKVENVFCKAMEITPPKERKMRGGEAQEAVFKERKIENPREKEVQELQRAIASAQEEIEGLKKQALGSGITSSDIEEAIKDRLDSLQKASIEEVGKLKEEILGEIHSLIQTKALEKESEEHVQRINELFDTSNVGFHCMKEYKDVTFESQRQAIVEVAQYVLKLDVSKGEDVLDKYIVDCSKSRSGIVGARFLVDGFRAVGFSPLADRLKDLLSKHLSQDQLAEAENIFRKTTEAETSSEVLKFPNTASLVETYANCWIDKRGFKDVPFNRDAFVATLQSCAEKCPPHPNFSPESHQGVIVKKDLEKGAKVYVRADLHGDLKSFVENLKTLQTEGLLDENFKCKDGAQLVFCGDYVDRGSYSLQVLQLLANLKMENPENVHVIRGNHEYLDVNYSYSDDNFGEFLWDENQKDENREIIKSFYESMPLTLYLGETGDSKQYVQFTHGLFELDVDPSEILDSEKNSASMLIGVHRPTSLSGRVQNLNTQEPLATLETKLNVTKKGDPLRKQLKMQIATKRISDLVQKQGQFSQGGLTAYNWGDVSPGENSSNVGYLGKRKWHMEPERVKDYLRISSASNKVKMIFRGHQHEFQHYLHNGKVLISTMPVGADSDQYVGNYNYQRPGVSLDRAYIMKTGEKVKDWKKQGVLRETGQKTQELTKEYPLQDKDI